MAEARHGIRLAEPLDHWLRKAFDSGVGLRTRTSALLADCMTAMESVATHLDESTGYFVNSLRSCSSASTRSRQERCDAAHRRRIEARRAAGRRLAEPSAAEQPLPGLVAEAPPSRAAAEARRSTSIRRSPRSSPTRPPSCSRPPSARWRTGAASLRAQELRLGLKRPLHTLKGGARMAGIMAMGDLSHELETLVMQIDNGTVPADERAVRCDAGEPR